MEYLDNGITTMRYVVSKIATMEGGLYLLTRNVPQRCVFQTSRLGI